MKARSRLKQTDSVSAVVIPNSDHKSTKTRSLEVSTPPIIKKYLQHIPILIVSLPLYYLVFTLLRSTSPERIANVLIPHLYLPLLLPLFLALLLSGSFLWLNMRRGFLTALFFVVIIFLRLNQVTAPSIFIGVGVLLLGYEFLASFLKRA